MGHFDPLKKLEREQNMDDWSAGVYLEMQESFRPNSMHDFIEVLAHMTKPLRGINRMLNNTSVFSVTGKQGGSPL